jgi:O-antigen ligase
MTTITQPNRIKQDAPRFIVGALLTAIAGYAVLHLFAFESLLENAAFLVTGVFVILALRARPWLPAAFLVAQVPFQGLLTSNFGVVGNLVTLWAILAFLMAQPFTALPYVLLGTTTQRLTGLFVLGFSVSALWAGLSAFETYVALFQKIALLFVVAAVMHGFRKGTRVQTLAWVVVGSTALMYALSEMEFYFGGSSLPFIGTRGVGLVDLIAQGEDLSGYQGSLLGAGESLSQNRFAFIGILSITLSVGLILTHRRGPGYLWAAIALLVVGFGFILTGSRTGTVGVAASIAVLLLAFGQARRQLAMGVAAIASLVFALWIIPQVLPTGTTIYTRIFQGDPSSDTFYRTSGTRIDQGRLEMWKAGLTLFRENPVTGVGLGRFGEEVAIEKPFILTRDPHSAYNQLMSESGLLGFLPFVMLMLHVLLVLGRNDRRLPEDMRRWRLIFLAALVGMMASAVFGTYQFERYFWVPIAFAAMLEVAKKRQPERLRPAEDVPASGPGGKQGYRVLGRPVSPATPG